MVELCFSKRPQCFLCWAGTVQSWLVSGPLGDWDSFPPSLPSPFFFTFFLLWAPGFQTGLSWLCGYGRPCTSDLWLPALGSCTRTCFVQSWGPNSGPPVPAQFLTLSVCMHRLSLWLSICFSCPYPVKKTRRNPQGLCRSRKGTQYPGASYGLSMCLVFSRKCQVTRTMEPVRVCSQALCVQQDGQLCPSRFPCTHLRAHTSL